jgi:hypothetical protein
MSGLDDGNHDHILGEEDILRFAKRAVAKPRRSMDIEFHDLNFDDLDLDDDDDDDKQGKKEAKPDNMNSQEEHNIKTNGKNNPSADDDVSSYDDSFGEASVDCKPDKQYMEELLDEEVHPERLNLLDGNILPRKDRRDRVNGIVTSDNESDRSDEDEHDWSESSSSRQEYDFDLSDHPDNEDGDSQSSENDKGNDQKDKDRQGLDSEHAEEAGQADDAFEGSPTRRTPSRPERGRSLKKQLENMGESTKKSFRTVGQASFFAQPFKGLARSLSGGRKKKKSTVDQQEIEQQEV